MIPVAPIVDWVALAVFVIGWIGYTRFADYGIGRRDSLTAETHQSRLDWMRAMMKRDMRIVDSQILAMTMRNVSLFASITVLVVGSLFASLGSVDALRVATEDLMFVVDASHALWEGKIIALTLVFVYGFFQFAWSLRQFNYTATLMGGAPEPDATDKHEAAAQRLAKLGTRAVRTYNRGMRCYYFGFTLLAWFLHPILLIVSTVGVVAIVYRQECHSGTLAILRGKD